MVEILKETQSVDGCSCVITQKLSDGSTREIFKHGKDIMATKTILPDGSYTKFNADNLKIEELSADGYLREYNPLTQKLRKETTPEKITTTFYDNGNIETIRDLQKETYASYYENKNIAFYETRDYEIYKDINGNVNYEFKDGKLEINPDWFSYYRLGVKSQNNKEHWEENVTLNPKKKTLLCLGGDQTKDARTANGNNNAFVGVLGLSDEQKDNLQQVSCYRPINSRLRYLWHRAGGLAKQIEKDYKREILQKFMPFMARKNNDKFEKLTDEELKENFANIMIQTHCYGANDLVRFNKVFKDALSELGYSETTQKAALKQIICITANSQREMTDNLDFSCFHRYSVKDGQFEPEYETKYSAAYPVFMQDHKSFTAEKGNQTAFITTKPNEMIMAFDKILLYASRGEEHNEGFWVTEKLDLTYVGKCQARLTERIGQFWYQNHDDVPDVQNLVQKVTEKTSLHAFIKKALTSGKKIKAENKNMLTNHHILKSEWNKFKNPNIKSAQNGIYKILSDKYKD